MRRSVLMVLIGSVIITTLVADEFNVAPFCRLKSTPYAGFSLTRLIDGGADQSATGRNYAGNVQFNGRAFQTDMRLNATVTFAFPVPYVLKKVRLFVSPSAFEGLVVGAASEYSVYADVKGNGIYDKKVGEVKNRNKGWCETEIKNDIKCSGIRIIPEGTTSTLTFGISEVEIFVIGKRPNIIRPEKSENVLKISEKKGMTDCKLARDTLKRVLYVWGPGIYSNPERCAKKLVEIGANTIILYPNSYAFIKDIEEGRISLPEDQECLWYVKRGIHLMKEKGKRQTHIATWPSKVVLGTKKNILKKVCDVMHKHSLKVIASASFYIPFDMVKVYFHGGQSDWHSISPSPCVISDEFPLRVGNQLYRELLENGADGVILGGDEFMMEGHRFTHISPYDPCIKKFRDKYGYESLPVDAEDTLRYRRWEMFEYEGLANLFKGWVDNVREINSKVIATCLLTPGPFCFNDRMWSGLAYDIIGYTSGMDYLTTDYFRPQTIMKRLIAASPSRKGGYTWRLGVFRPTYLPFKNRIDLNGPVLSLLGQSGKGLASLELFERRHIMVSKAVPDAQREQGFKDTKKLFHLIKQLQKQGVSDAEVPKDIAFLYSRSSEDWWQLKNDYIQSRSPTIMMNAWGKENWRKEFSKRITPERTKANFKQMEGYIWNQAVMDLLVSRGYNFDMFYLDQVEGLKNISNYKLLVIPFGYSISKKAATIIDQAVNKGVSLLVINHLGEVDEMGKKYKVPVLKSLLSHKNVFLVNFDIEDKGEQDLLDSLQTIINKPLRDRPEFILPDQNLYGRIFCYFLKKDSRYFITLVNYDRQNIKINVKLPGIIKDIRGFDTENIYKYDTVQGKNAFDYVIPGEQAVVLTVDTK